jgi:hypothetical protein
MDLELNEFQLLGRIPKRVMDQLWPGFVPQDYDVYVNPVSLRRHMQSHDIERVATLNAYAGVLSTAFSSPCVYAKYAGVASNEASVTVYMEVETDPGQTGYLALGVRLLEQKSDGSKLNHVTTLIPPTPWRRLESRLKKVKFVWAE